jgi:hypothetical protein
MDKNNKPFEEPKKAYAKPTLLVHGDVEVITQGYTTGDHLDAAFPAGFPVHDVTLS